MSSRGVQPNPALAGMAAPATSRRMRTATEMRAEYHDRLEDHVGKAMDAFKEIVACCEIGDRATNARMDFQSQVESANLAKAADELLRLVSELKIAVIVQDGRENVKEVRAILEVERGALPTEMRRLRESVGGTLATLEKHYYASRTRWEGKDVENGNA